MTILAAAILGVVTMTAQTETTLAVRPGTRLDVSNFGGRVAVSTWGRNAVRIEASHDRGTWVRVEPRASDLRVMSSARGGARERVAFRITVPVWMAVSVSGPFNDVSVAGTRNDVTVKTFRGDVDVDGGVGFISLSTVQGLVNLQRARGRIWLSSINEGIRASDIAGEIQAQTVSGNVTLDDVRSEAVEASSVSGDLSYRGALRSPGRYRFETHDGAIEMLLPEKPDATVSVSMFNGELDCDYDMRIEDLVRNRHIQFVLGSGGPFLELETFSGNVSLRRAAETLRRSLQTEKQKMERERVKLERKRIEIQKVRPHSPHGED